MNVCISLQKVSPKIFFNAFLDLLGKAKDGLEELVGNSEVGERMQFWPYV